MLAPQNADQVVAELGGQQLSAREAGEKLRLLPRRRYPDAAAQIVGDYREIDRAEEAGLLQSQAVEVSIDVIGPHPVDEYVRRHVVGERDRELDRVSQRDSFDLELLENPSAGESSARRGQIEALLEACLVSRNQVENGAADSDLDHRRGRKELFLADADLFAALEMDAVEPESSRERLLEYLDSLLEREVRARRDRHVLHPACHANRSLPLSPRRRL
jgi:hypothetical protein